MSLLVWSNVRVTVFQVVTVHSTPCSQFGELGLGHCLVQLQPARMSLLNNVRVQTMSTREKHTLACVVDGMSACPRFMCITMVVNVESLHVVVLLEFGLILFRRGSAGSPVGWQGTPPWRKGHGTTGQYSLCKGRSRRS